MKLRNHESVTATLSSLLTKIRCVTGRRTRMQSKSLRKSWKRQCGDLSQRASPKANYQRVGSASADTQRDWGNCSRLYEVNIWTWRYGRGRSRMVSIAEAERIRSERVSESRTRAAETRKLRSEQAGSGAAGCSAE